MKQSLRRVGTGGLALWLTTAVLPAQSAGDSARQESVSQQQQMQQILDELHAIRQLLERVVPPQSRPPQLVRMDRLEGFTLGRSDAPVTMVEFTDLQCPYCREYALTVFDSIRTNWIDTGKLRYISRDLPLDIHPEANNAAQATRCSGEQGKFWEMRTTLMRNAQLLSRDYITRTAADLKLDVAAFSRCLAEKSFDSQIQADVAEAASLGISGTPAFVLGRTDGAVLNGFVLIGTQPYTVFDAKLKELFDSGSK